jgi:hypothetical protein
MTSAEAAGTPTGRSGSSAIAPLSGGLATALFAVAGSAWYARRRWLRRGVSCSKRP